MTGITAGIIFLAIAVLPFPLRAGQLRAGAAKGVITPVTIVLAGPNRVLQCKMDQSDGYSAVQLGFNEQKEARMTKPLLVTVAADGLDEVQVTWGVISRVVPSEYVPKAANCVLVPAGTFESVGVAEMETISALDPPEPPHPTERRKTTSRRLENKPSLFIIPSILFTQRL
jgi:hypothetical protein